MEALGLIEMDAFLHVKNDVKYPAVLAVVFGELNFTFKRLKE